MYAAGCDIVGDGGGETGVVVVGGGAVGVSVDCVGVTGDGCDVGVDVGVDYCRVWS